MSTRRSWWWIGVAAVAVLAGGAAVAARAGLIGEAPAPAPTGTATPAAVAHASGTIEALRGPEGIDLDTNVRTGQLAPGVDISFSTPIASHLNAMAHRVYFAVMPPGTPEQRTSCERAAGWVRQIPIILDLVEGRAICVKTDEGRLSNHAAPPPPAAPLASATSHGPNRHEL